MYAAVTCHDYAQIYDMTLPPALRRRQRDEAVARQAHDNPALYAPFTIAEYRGVPLDYSLLDACVDWPVPPPAYPPGPPVPPQPAMPTIPVLVLNGKLDTITTPTEGGIVASLFANARHVVVANTFHLTAQPPMRDNCGATLVRRFITTLDPGDVSCAAAVAPIRTPPLFARRVADVPPARPLAGNRADAAALRAAAAALWTLGDATARVESANGCSIGLRGGSFTITQQGQAQVLTLDSVRWADDLAVSGSLHWPLSHGDATASIQLWGPDGLQGNLVVRWPVGPAGAQATLSGTLGGLALRAQTDAP
jgi:hypothetical protein